MSDDPYTVDDGRIVVEDNTARRSSDDYLRPSFVRVVK
jgi:hypothetical protein